MKILPVIMAGGHGTRLWPLSRENYPKQFIKIFGGKSLVQLCMLRHKSFGEQVIIVGPEHRFIAQEQAEEMAAEIGSTPTIIIEPVGKNTAPCAILASLLLDKKGYDTALLLPSDHYIDNEDNYINTILEAAGSLQSASIATIGIKPTSGHTGYGYIKAGSLIKGKLHNIEKFVEKPSKDKAEEYFASKQYYWNSGIFLFGSKMISLAQNLAPEMYKLVKESFENSENDLNFTRLASESFAQIEGDSIDYAIMEKAENTTIQEAGFGWSDLGSFASIWDIEEKDSDRNVKIGDVFALNSSGNYIYSEEKLTVISGLSDLVVINTHDATLIAPKDKSEDIKHAVNHLKKMNRHEVVHSDKSFRPWGSYQIIDEGYAHKVKRIIVQPGKKLSLQFHHKRAEHWIVVRGVAEVQVGEDIKILQENDSIYIPKLVKHRLSNIGEVPLHLIEVQTGDYLGEDDIVRLSDSYGRK